MNGELVRAILDCGTMDMNLLDDAGCDMFSVISDMREDGTALTMNNIIRQVFMEGRSIIILAHEQKKADMPAEPMTEADFELNQKMDQLNPLYDFTFEVNLQDTHFCGKSELQSVYEDLFPEELEKCEELTGYPIEW